MKQLIKRLTEFRIFVVVCLIVVLAAPLAYAGKVQLPEGKEIKVRFDPKMKISSGNLEKGVPLQIYLMEPIEIAGVVIVPKDAPGTAVVADVKKAGKPGKPGMIKIEFTELEPTGDFKSTDGEKIKLSGTIEKKGGGKKLLSYLFIFGLFIKGGEGTIDPNGIYTATVKEGIILEN